MIQTSHVLSSGIIVVRYINTYVQKVASDMRFGAVAFAPSYHDTLPKRVSY